MRIFDLTPSMMEITAAFRQMISPWEQIETGLGTEAGQALFADLATDMHAHWLPGVDDGASDLAQGLEIVSGLVRLGFSRLIATPHISAERYPNTPEQLRAAFEDFSWAVSQAGLEVSLHLAAEYMLDEAFIEHMKSGDLLTLDGKHILIEMPLFFPFPSLHEVIFQLRTKGLQPVLAHPERYLYLHGNRAELEAIQDADCLLQLDLLSLTGQYGAKVQRMARKLMKRGAYQLAGSDLHHPRQLKRLEALPWKWQQSWLNPAL